MCSFTTRCHQTFLTDPLKMVYYNKDLSMFCFNDMTKIFIFPKCSIVPDRLKLDSWRSLMPPCRVQGRVGVSRSEAPMSLFPELATAATSPL